MNNKIREILAQCSMESIDGLFANKYVDQEKFAKLIILECVNVLKKTKEIELEFMQKINTDIKELPFECLCCRVKK